MHLSRTFEIKGSDKFSVAPWPLLTSWAWWWAVKHTPVPSAGELNSPPSALPCRCLRALCSTEDKGAQELFLKIRLKSTTPSFYSMPLLQERPSQLLSQQIPKGGDCAQSTEGQQARPAHGMGTQKPGWRETLSWVQGKYVLLSILKKSTCCYFPQSQAPK